MSIINECFSSATELPQHAAAAPEPSPTAGTNGLKQPNALDSVAAAAGGSNAEHRSHREPNQAALTKPQHVAVERRQRAWWPSATAAATATSRSHAPGLPWQRHRSERAVLPLGRAAFRQQPDTAPATAPAAPAAPAAATAAALEPVRRQRSRGE